METKISSNLPPWRPKVHKGTFLRIAFLSILFQILLERLPHTYYRSFFLVGSTPTKWRVPVSCKLDGNSVADPGEGPGGPAPLISWLNWGSKGRKLFLDPPPPRLYLRVWMTAPSPYLKVWIRHGTGNIALLISVMFPPCRDMLIYVSMYATRFRSVMLSFRTGNERSSFRHISVITFPFFLLLSLFMVWHLIFLTICVVKTLLVPRVQSTKYGLHSFRYSASKYWNMLPEVLRTADHYTCF